MAVSEHESRYTPSNWSKRFNSTELLLNFTNLHQNVLKEVRDNVEHSLDNEYGSTDRTKYDIYGTNLPNDAPILVFIHGGYWQEMTKDLAVFTVPVLISKGIKVVAIGYDLCPNVKLGDIVAEIKKAMENILMYAKNQGSRKIWLAGHSAGGHLAASLLHDKEWMDRMSKYGYLDLFNGIILMAGLYNLKPLLTTSFNDVLQLTDNEIKNYSFANLVTEHHVSNLKVIVVVGECDSPVFIEESSLYAQNLIKFVDNVEYILLRDNIDHFDILENMSKPDFTLTQIIIKNILQ